MLCNRNGAVIAHRRHDHSERPVWGFYHGRRFVLECDVKTLTCKNLTRRGYAIQENGARVAVIVDNQKRCRMVGGFKRQRHAAFVICSKRFKRGYGMLSRLDIGADSFLRHLVIQDNLAGIAIQRHALPNTVFDGDDNLSATGETDRTLGCTTVRVELAYGMLLSPQCFDIACSSVL